MFNPLSSNDADASPSPINDGSYEDFCTAMLRPCSRSEVSLSPIHVFRDVETAQDDLEPSARRSLLSVNEPNPACGGACGGTFARHEEMQRSRPQPLVNMQDWFNFKATMILQLQKSHQLPATHSRSIRLWPDGSLTYHWRNGIRWLRIYMVWRTFRQRHQSCGLRALRK